MRVVGLKERHSTYPLIELCGPINCGKFWTAKLLSSKLFGSFLSFPNTDFKSFTARTLFHYYVNDPSYLEKYPSWWVKLYSAHLTEYQDLIIHSLKKGPVVVTNYVNSFRAWSSALGINHSSQFNSLTFDLIKPNTRLYLLGPSWSNNSSTVNPEFSDELAVSISNGIRRSQGFKVDLEEVPIKQKHAAINKAAHSFLEHLRTKYPDLKTTDFPQYTSDLVHSF